MRPTVLNPLFADVTALMRAPGMGRSPDGAQVTPLTLPVRHTPASLTMAASPSGSESTATNSIG